MIDRFAFSNLSVVPRPRYSRPVAGGLVTPAGPQPAPIHPLLPLLNSLRGRVIGVITGGREAEGRLVLADPVTLISTDGTTTLIALDYVSSVRF